MTGSMTLFMGWAIITQYALWSSYKHSRRQHHAATTYDHQLWEGGTDFHDRLKKEVPSLDEGLAYTSSVIKFTSAVWIPIAVISMGLWGVMSYMTISGMEVLNGIKVTAGLFAVASVFIHICFTRTDEYRRYVVWGMEVTACAIRSEIHRLTGELDNVHKAANGFSEHLRDEPMSQVISELADLSTKQITEEINTLQAQLKGVEALINLHSQ